MEKNEYAFEDNMAAFIKIGAWFDYLKEEGVYDNTRIILADGYWCEVTPGDIFEGKNWRKHAE